MDMIKSDCNGIGGWLWGHKYVARYDEQGYLPARKTTITDATPQQIRALRFEEKTYVHDICIRCGSKILR